MTLLTPESFTTEYPRTTPFPVPNRLGLVAGSFVHQLAQRIPRVSVQKPYFSHDRTIVTVVVLACGTLLLWHYGDSSPIVALVSAGWTLALTFWFRFNADPEGKDR